MEPVGREEIMLSLKSTSVNEVDKISRRRIKFWWKVRYFSQTQVHHDSMIPIPVKGRGI